MILLWIITIVKLKNYSIMQLMYMLLLIFPLILHNKKYKIPPKYHIAHSILKCNTLEKRLR